MVFTIVFHRYLDMLGFAREECMHLALVCGSWFGLCSMMVDLFETKRLEHKARCELYCVTSLNMCVQVMQLDHVIV
jgi:hypothetical protein